MRVSDERTTPFSHKSFQSQGEKQKSKWDRTQPEAENEIKEIHSFRMNNIFKKEKKKNAGTGHLGKIN